MGTSKQKSAAIRIRQNAHVDEAYLAHGFVSKNVQLVVSDIDVAELVSNYNYLEQVTED